MNDKMIELATKAGFPVSTTDTANFSYKEKFGLFGSTEVSLDSEIEKFAELLFDEFVTQWWVKRHGKMENPF